MSSSRKKDRTRGDPDPALCRTAIKVLEQFDRLARKYALQLPPKRIMELKALRHSGMIKATDLPAKLRTVFPAEFFGMTLREIREWCGKKRNDRDVDRPPKAEE